MRSLLPLLFLFACQPTKTPSTNERPKPLNTAPGAALSLPAPVSTMRDRAVFAQRLSTIKVGDSAEEIRGLLGAPDDIRSPKDGIVTSRTREVWCYGTNAHSGFPTLGWVYLDEQDRAQYVWGGGAVTAGLPPEAALLPLLRAIDQVPSLQGYTFQPGPLIAAVNALQPLGKAQALAVLSEYLRVSSRFDSPAREGVFLVLRALFEVPADPGYMPVMLVGGPHPPGPEDLTVFPRFPLHLEGDLPMLLVSGYVLAGKAQDPEEHLEYFAEKGTLRSAPLHPTENPTKLLEALMASHAVYGEKTAEGAMLADQLLSLLAPGSKKLVGDAAWPESWRSLSTALEAKRLRWDEASQRYLAP